MFPFELALLRLTLITFSILFLSTITYAQVVGCKDPAANNYNPAATVNDGNCLYNPTSYTPPVQVSSMNSTLIETSGLQWAGNSLWTINDGGPTATATLYRISTTANAILQTVLLDGASNIDWEDIAFDGTHFYIGDFGNNATGTRTNLKIYKFPFSAIPADYVVNPTVTVPSSQIEVISFTYSDQTDFSKDTANYTKFDCEAMIVDGGKIHLFTKNWIDISTTHYVINSTMAGTYVASPLETLATGYLVTAADKAQGANAIVLLGYQNSGAANHFLHLLSDYNSGKFFNGNKRQINLPNVLTMGQAEGIAFKDATTGFISNEEFAGFIPSRLRSFNLAAFTPAYVLPLQLKEFTVQGQNGKQLVRWSFASAVNDLQLLHSSDGANFQVLENIGSVVSGAITHASYTTPNCYRLKWRQPAGNYNYSSVICAENKSVGVTNVVMHSGGKLSFSINAPEADNYVVTLVSTDGRLLAKTQQRITAAGLHTINFATAIADNQLVLVQIIGKKNQYKQIVRVIN